MTSTLRARATRAVVVLAAGAVALTGTTLAVAPASGTVPGQVVVPVTADRETTPTLNAGDSADDPALWVDHDDPASSLVIGNDKKGALEVYDLTGQRVQRITTATPFWGNVDVRQDVTIGAFTGDLVTSGNGQGVRAFAVDHATHRLVPVTDGNGVIKTGGGEGHCLYAAPSGAVYAVKITRPGRLRQYQLTDPDRDGLLSATLVRELQVGSETEGCVADDQRGDLYVGQEDVGLWRYSASPTAGDARVSIDTVDSSGHLSADVEGVTLARWPTGDVLIASAQNLVNPKRSYFVVYDLPSGAYRGSFRIADGGAAADGCTRTDGVTAYAGDLGPAFPQGVFVCQDNNNTGPGTSGNQDFKLTRLERVLAAVG